MGSLEADRPDPDTTDLPAYVAFGRFVDLLDRLESAGIPGRVDRGYWYPYLRGAVGARLMGTLRFLNLIDAASESKTELAAVVPQENRKQVLGALLKQRYKPIFELADPARATRLQLDKAFKETFTVAGDTRRKAVTFFLKAASYAELPLSSYVGLRSTPTRKRTRGKAAESRLCALDVSRFATGAESPPTATHTVSLPKNAGSITLIAQVNWLTLRPDQRTRILALVDKLNELAQEPE